jgi:hypothetical protein
VGNEANCTMRRGKQRAEGKALLETAEVIFRPADGSARVKIPFSAIQSAKAVDGELRLETADGAATFDLGPAAEKWCEKILHPKTRADKLGVEDGMKVAVVGDFDAEFLEELRNATKIVSEGKIEAGSELIFLSMSTAKDLAPGVGKATKAMRGATALWIVYPKGKKDVTENDVLTAGRKAGLKDVKVVGFSATHTALKFVVPVAKR